MYASDLTHQKRAATIYTNLQLQKDWFNSGKTIRILGQKGGNDYSYMNQVKDGFLADKTWQNETPFESSPGNGSLSSDIGSMIKANFTGITDTGYTAPLTPISNVLDDSFIPIPMGGMNFYFFGTNYGSLNQVLWNSNNAVVFGSAFYPNNVSLSRDTAPSILMGNYDRLCSELYSLNYTAQGGKFSITKVLVRFSNYFTDTTNLTQGSLQVRFIRENTGKNRQWIEVGVISSVERPGYSNNPSVTYHSGFIDSDGNAIDATKNSPWDLTDGSNFQNVTGSLYTTAFPPAGTTMVYESDALGFNWRFSTNRFLNIV